MPILSVRDATMSYGGNVAVEHVSFDVEAGQCVCIVGSNGAGKSTLLKGIAGVQPCKSGQIVWDKTVRRAQIGYLAQQTEVQKDFPASVGEVVLSGCAPGLGLRPFYGAAERRRAAQMLKLLGVADLKKKPFRSLSGGQRQRVLIAKALCGAERVLLMDEPVSGLDPQVTQTLYALIRQLSEEGVTVVMVSHDVDRARGVADRVLHLERTVLFYGAASEYWADEPEKAMREADE